MDKQNQVDETQPKRFGVTLEPVPEGEGKSAAEVKAADEAARKVDPQAPDQGTAADQASKYPSKQTEARMAEKNMDTEGTPPQQVRPNKVEPPLKEPTAAAKADPTLMVDKTDPANTHVPPEEGKADPGEDKSFDNRNNPAYQKSVSSTSGSTSDLHAGNAMGAVSGDHFETNFGMAREGHPDKSIPQGQIQSVSIKDATPAVAGTNTPDPQGGFTKQQEPSVFAMSDRHIAPKKYKVVINPVSTDKTVFFRNGDIVQNVETRKEVEVSEAIYNAIKDSSIPFTAKPI